MEKRLIYREILVLLVFGIIIPSFDSVSDTGNVDIAKLRVLRFRLNTGTKILSILVNKIT